MKRVFPFVAILAALIVGSGCMTEARRDRAFAEVLADWRTDHPDADLTVEIEAQLRAAAEERAAGQVSAERKAAISKASEAAGKFAGGDLVGGGLAILGIIGLGVAGYKKKKGPTIADQLATERARDAERHAAAESSATPPAGGGTPEAPA